MGEEELSGHGCCRLSLYTSLPPSIGRVGCARLSADRFYYDPGSRIRFFCPLSRTWNRLHFRFLRLNMLLCREEPSMPCYPGFVLVLVTPSGAARTELDTTNVIAVMAKAAHAPHSQDRRE